MSDDDDWPPGESPAEWVWETPQGTAMHFGSMDSVVLEPEQVQAEVRRKRRAKRGFGFQ